MQHGQQQGGLLSKEELRLDLAVCDHFGLGQRVRCADHMVRHETNHESRRHCRNVDGSLPSSPPALWVVPAAQKSLQNEAVGEQDHHGSIKEQRHAEEDSQGVPVQPHPFLQ